MDELKVNLCRNDDFWGEIKLGGLFRQVWGNLAILKGIEELHKGTKSSVDSVWTKRENVAFDVLCERAEEIELRLEEGLRLRPCRRSRHGSSDQSDASRSSVAGGAQRAFNVATTRKKMNQTFNKISRSVESFGRVFSSLENNLTSVGFPPKLINNSE